jgi:hypothetical protein
MPTYNVRVFIGPLSRDRVRELHRALKAARVPVVSQGTEHLTLRSRGMDCEGALWNAGVKLNKKGLPNLQSYLLRRVGRKPAYHCTIVRKRRRKGR